MKLVISETAQALSNPNYSFINTSVNSNSFD